MVELLLFGDACAGVPGGRQSRLRSDAKLPRQTAQSGHSWQSPFLSGRCVRRTRRAATVRRLLWIVTDSFTTKSIGEPDAGNRHVWFDERGWETGWAIGPKPPRPSSTLRAPRWRVSPVEEGSTQIVVIIDCAVFRAHPHKGKPFSEGTFLYKVILHRSASVIFA